MSDAPQANQPLDQNKKWRIFAFVVMVIIVGWIDLTFFDRAMPMVVWYIASGAVIVVALNWMIGKKDPEER